MLLSLQHWSNSATSDKSQYDFIPSANPWSQHAWKTNAVEGNVKDFQTYDNDTLQVDNI